MGNQKTLASLLVKQENCKDVLNTQYIRNITKKHGIFFRV